MSESDPAARLAAIRARIAAAGRAPEEIVVVAVTKGFGADALDAAASMGLDDVGENYAQELADKWKADPNPARRWHFLGRVQRNKVKAIAPAVHLWQGVDRLAAGEEIARRAPGARVLVQVNIDGAGPASAGRNGCHPAEVPGLVDRLGGLGLDVRGLMAVGPKGPPELARAGFREVTALADRLGLAERSMGMTDDLDVAVEEGSTMVRVGRALFGARPVATTMRR
jgi:pyridoxal phosphate enzyme (YggS family)